MRDGWIEATLREALEPIAIHPNGKDFPLVLSVTEKRGIIPQTEIFKHRIATDDISKYKVLEPMDIAYNPYLLWCGAIGQWKGTEAGVVSPVYECFRVKSNCEPRYLGYIFETGILTNYFDALAIGSIVRRRRTIPSDFIAAPIQLPPLSEQKRIVDLISSVDSYISCIKQELECAKRSRDAVLHDLFTASDVWPEIGLEVLEDSGVIKLGRGDVISKKDMEADPGPNPVYSSAENKNGMIGQYAKYMFDEELITWSIDGGGHIFYRPKHKFSVTNIGGWLRILDDSIFSYQFLTFALQRLRKQHHFDWQSKAHPSVLRTLYTRIPSPPLAEQNRIVGVISAIDEVISQSDNAISVARDLRSGLLSDLLSGTHEIPASYDKVIGAAR